MIIMLQWVRLYTLGSRGSRELKTFVETRLISSRVDQKLKNKGVHEFLKKKLARRLWPIEAFVRAVFKRHGGDSLGMGRGFKSASNRLDFSSNFASRVPRFSPRSRHDWAAIGRQSCCSSFVDRLPIDGRRIRSDPAPSPPRSRLDRAAIVEFFHDRPSPSDYASGERVASIARSRGPRFR